jgi:flagellar motor switch protein FliG
MITGSFLKKMRRRALRKGVLYNALDRVEQGILSLAGKLVDSIKSEMLGVQIVKILAKLKKALNSEFQKHVESYGLEKANERIEQAENFGNIVDWLSLKYATYLAFLDFNNPIGWKSI